MNQIDVLNRALFLSIDAAPGTPRWLIDGAIVMANDLIYLVPTLLVVMWLWGNDARRRLAVKAFLVAMFGLGLGQIIGLLWPHPRPFMIGLGRTWLTHAADSSFPSDHLTVFSAAGLTLLLGGELLWALVTFVIAVCVAWARVFLGLHFPIDMLGALGVACLSYAGLSPAWREAGDRLIRVLERFYRMLMAWPIARGFVRR